jgi:UDP-N-acetyl-D-glucosamine/UDP-N-acetyl-D-galactosamine dehydrogenase
MNANLFDQLCSGTAKIAIVGLGYVGLPLACEFAKRYSVIGFDISEKKIDSLVNGIDPTGELSPAELAQAKVTFSLNPSILSEASVIIVTVPTPIDRHNTPDLSPLAGASHLIGTHMTKGTVIVYESTVYPGVTEEYCVPILEATSQLIYGVDFTVGYSPERLNPGDKNHTVDKIVKVVSGSTPDTLKFVSTLYGSIIHAGIHEAPSIKVAEAAKVIENTQRDLNVALMNELSIIFNKMGINTLDVIEAAATKWNFIKMFPGLVGGHCIGVDPYYLTFKAQELGYHPEVILAGRRINDNMGKYIAEQTIKQMINADISIKGATVLVLGITFKENISDIRNSKVIDIIRELTGYGVNVLVADPHANSADIYHEYNVNLTAISDIHRVDSVVVAVPHFLFKKDDTLSKLLSRTLSPQGLVVDIKGGFKELAARYRYWSL